MKMKRTAFIGIFCRMLTFSSHLAGVGFDGLSNETLPLMKKSNCDRVTRPTQFSSFTVIWNENRSLCRSKIPGKEKMKTLRPEIETSYRNNTYRCTRNHKRSS